MKILVFFVTRMYNYSIVRIEVIVMNNKGFTLIELLAVIVILAIILTITIVSYNNVVNKTEFKISEIQIDKIEEAAEVYYLKEGINNSNEETEHCIELSYLIDHGYLDNSNIIDAYERKEMNGSVTVTFKNNVYIYKYSENLCPIVNDQ